MLNAADESPPLSFSNNSWKAGTTSNDLPIKRHVGGPFHMQTTGFPQLMETFSKVVIFILVFQITTKVHLYCWVEFLTVKSKYYFFFLFTSNIWGESKSFFVLLEIFLKILRIYIYSSRSILASKNDGINFLTSEIQYKLSWRRLYH